MYTSHIVCTPLLRSSTTLRTRPSSLDAERHPRWGIVAARSGVAASRAVRSTASSRGACHCVYVHIPPPHIMTLPDCTLLHIGVCHTYIYIYRGRETGCPQFPIVCSAFICSAYTVPLSVLLYSGVPGTSRSASRPSTSWACLD